MPGQSRCQQVPGTERAGKFWEGCWAALSQGGRGSRRLRSVLNSEGTGPSLPLPALLPPTPTLPRLPPDAQQCPAVGSGRPEVWGATQRALTHCPGFMDPCGWGRAGQSGASASVHREGELQRGVR